VIVSLVLFESLATRKKNNTKKFSALVLQRLSINCGVPRHWLWSKGCAILLLESRAVAQERNRKNE
jgi:hypothetical protein